MQFQKIVFTLIFLGVSFSCKKPIHEPSQKLLTTLPDQENPDLESMINVGSIFERYQPELRKLLIEKSAETHSHGFFSKGISFLLNKLFVQLSTTTKVRAQIKFEDHETLFSWNHQTHKTPAEFHLKDQALARFLPTEAMLKVQWTFPKNEPGHRFLFWNDFMIQFVTKQKPELEEAMLHYFHRWMTLLEGSTWAYALNIHPEQQEQFYAVGLIDAENPTKVMDFLEEYSKFYIKNQDTIQNRKKEPDTLDLTPKDIASSPQTRHISLTLKDTTGPEILFKAALFKNYILFQIGSNPKMLPNMATAIEKNDAHFLDSMKSFPLGGTAYVDINAQKFEQAFFHKKEKSALLFQALQPENATIRLIRYGTPENTWFRLSIPQPLFEQVAKSPTSPLSAEKLLLAPEARHNSPEPIRN